MKKLQNPDKMAKTIQAKIRKAVVSFEDDMGIDLFTLDLGLFEVKMSLYEDKEGKIHIGRFTYSDLRAIERELDAKVEKKKGPNSKNTSQQHRH